MEIVDFLENVSLKIYKTNEDFSQSMFRISTLPTICKTLAIKLTTVFGPTKILLCEALFFKITFLEDKSKLTDLYLKNPRRISPFPRVRSFKKLAQGKKIYHFSYYLHLL